MATVGIVFPFTVIGDDGPVSFDAAGDFVADVADRPVIVPAPPGTD